MTALTIGSLFSGVGGLELGLERSLGARVIWQAESDPYCRGVLARHYPKAKRYEDVRDIDARAERPDIICGGFPCQDISLAGSGAGLGGARSGLWFEYARIVRELRPRFVVVENVAALRTRGLDVVLGNLSALGYNAFWDCFPAAAIGAPHRRDRLYLVAWRVSDAERDGLRNEPERGRGPAFATDGGNAEPQHLGAFVADAASDRLGQFCAEPERDGRGGPFGARDDLADSDSRRLTIEREPHRQSGQRSACGNELDRCTVPQWPPSPDDLHAWGAVHAEAEAGVRRVVDGFSAWLANVTESALELARERWAPKRRQLDLFAVGPASKSEVVSLAREMQAEPARRRSVPCAHAARLLLRGEHEAAAGVLTDELPDAGALLSELRHVSSLQPAFCSMEHTEPERALQLHALGNAVVPQVGELVGYVIATIDDALSAREQSA